MRKLLSLAVPALVLAAAWLLVPAMPNLPASFAGLKVYGSWGVLALGAILGLAFRRGRVVFALLTLALADAGYALFAHDGLGSPAAPTVYAALCVFVPVNLAALSLLPERGTFNIYGMQRLGVIAAEVIFVLWIVFAFKTEFTDWAYAPLYQTKLLAASPIPQVGLALLALGFAVSSVAWLVRQTPIDLGFAGAIAAFGIAANGVLVPHLYPVFIAAAGLIFTIAVLQDTFRMAFRDELTGLPSRRDLNEHMMSLGRRYAIAMADVDHFKQFNDTYGHDRGDQVLKMVATKIAGVGGGGNAYRYGGEEFTVVFPGKDIRQALPHLEALRQAVAGYKLALRAPDRPVQSKSDKRKRGAFRKAKSVSVTISIGVAERNDRLTTPAEVIAAADKALYRAKDKGRDQVSK